MTGVRTVKGALIALTSCVVLVGCGSGAGGTATDAESSAPTASEPTSATSTPAEAAEPITMRDACPEVETVLPGGMIPGFGKVSAYVDRMTELREQGDTETQNALDLVIPPANALMMVLARNGSGTDLTDAISAHLDGLSAFADRCRAAGSSALQ